MSTIFFLSYYVLTLVKTYLFLLESAVKLGKLDEHVAAQTVHNFIQFGACGHVTPEKLVWHQTICSEKLDKYLSVSQLHCLTRSRLILYGLNCLYQRFPVVGWTALLAARPIVCNPYFSSLGSFNPCDLLLLVAVFYHVTNNDLPWIHPFFNLPDHTTPISTVASGWMHPYMAIVGCALWVWTTVFLKSHWSSVFTDKSVAGPIEKCMQVTC